MDIEVICLSSQTSFVVVCAIYRIVSRMNEFKHFSEREFFCHLPSNAKKQSNDKFVLLGRNSAPWDVIPRPGTLMLIG